MGYAVRPERRQQRRHHLWRRSWRGRFGPLPAVPRQRRDDAHFQLSFAQHHQHALPRRARRPLFCEPHTQQRQR